MDKKQQPIPQTPDSPKTPKSKKPYQPPAVIYRDELEAMAGVCSPGGKTTAPCNPIVS